MINTNIIKDLTSNKNQKILMNLSSGFLQLLLLTTYEHYYTL